MKLRIALLQMAPIGSDQKANIAKGDTFCRRARAMGGDIALFPEMWNIGYSPPTAQPGGIDAWKEMAVPCEGEYVRHFQHLARELDMAIAITYLEKWAGSPRNTVSLIDRRGDILFSYAKVHTCSFDWESTLTPGNEFRVADLETAQGRVAVGAMICFDREFPETARLLMLKGAEIILVPNCCDMEINRLSQLRARSFENMLGIALANHARAKRDYISVAFDGIAFSRDETSRDMVLIQTGPEEGAYVAEFDIDQLRAYRASEVWGHRHRRPELYGLLSRQMGGSLDRRGQNVA